MPQHSLGAEVASLTLASGPNPDTLVPASEDPGGQETSRRPETFPQPVSWRVTDEVGIPTTNGEAGPQDKYPVNQRNRLAPPPSEASRAESFASIKTVDDMGHDAHITWERSAKQHVGDFPVEDSIPSRIFANRRLGVDIEVTADSIGDEIRASYQKSAFDKENFLPLDALCGIIRPVIVRKLLQDAFPKFDANKIDSYAIEILGTPNNNNAVPRRRKIFAILTLMAEIRLIQDFVEGEIDDKNLPLQVERNQSHRPAVRLCSKPDEPQGCFDAWKYKHADEFYLYQAAVCTPFFGFPGQEVSYYSFDYKAVLPFVESNQPTVGGYGTVRKVKLHHAHHNNNGDCKV